MSRTRSVRTALATLVVGGLACAGLLPTAAAAELSLSGAGSNRDPYQIASADDLVAVADAINEEPGRFGSASYRLTADIDFAGAEFDGINTFSGVLDGAGHSISDITYGTHPDDGDANRDSRALIRRVSQGTVRNLTLDGVRADNGDDAGFVAGLAVFAVGATVTGNSVIDADLTARSAEKVAGIIAELDGGTVTDNRVHGTIVAGEMPAGAVAYAKGTTLVANNLVDVDLTMLTGGGSAGTRGNDAGHVLAYPGTPNDGTFTGNVALGGTIDYSGKVDGFTGRIIGYTGYDGWTAEDNLASTAITISGESVTGPGTRNQHGADTTPEQLAQRATYEELGWDFNNAWDWDEELAHPVPATSYSLFGTGTEENPFEIGTEEDLELLAAQLNAGNGKYTGDKHYVLTGDLDFTGRAAFPGIDRFEGVLDGAGRTVRGLTYGPSSDSNQLGLVRQLDGASVHDLTLAGVTADGGQHPDLVAGLAVIATDSTIEGVSIIDVELVAHDAEKVAGLSAEVHGDSIVRASWVDGTISADKMPAGVASYATDDAQITDNLVSVDLTTRQTGGARGVDAGHVLAYPGHDNSVSVERNVAHSGDIAYSGTVPGFAGRILGFVGPDSYRVASLRDNLALDSIRIDGATVTGAHDDQNGADTSADDLQEQATYEAIGWDFAEDWRFDAELGHPVPHVISDDQRPNRITTTFHGDSQTQRAFSWYSSIADGEAVVRISSDREFPEGESTFDVPAEQRTSRDGETFYQAVAAGLQPGSTYHYRVGDRAAQVWSPTGAFVTSDGEDDFTFVNLTDTQSQNEDEAELSAATIAKSLTHVPEAEFIVHNGDVVENGDREQDWIDLLDAAQPSLLSTTVAPAAGNHEATAGGFVDHFALDAPNGQDTESGAYYSFDYNRAHFVVLNTNEDPEQAVSDAQLEWLRSDVTAARDGGAEWIIMSLHKGPYTTATHLDDHDIVAMRDVLVPLIDELDIDLVLQGHDHVMSRSKVLVSDPDGVENAAVAETTVITEMKNGKRAEYAVDPDGTIYFLPNTAGAKHYTQATEAADGIDLDAYLDLFDRTGEQDTENFAGITVTEDRLTVDVYDIRAEGSPRVFESFGVDRQVSPVSARIDALPEPSTLSVDDADAVGAARDAVDSLSTAQQGAVENLDRLAALEQRLRELGGLVSTDGSTLAWADGAATERQPITVRNTTRSDFTGAPVQVRLADTPDVAADALAVLGTDGAPLAYEVERWQPGETSVLWIKLPQLAAGSATTVWAYYGGSGAGNDPTQVWGEDYALVEHLATPSEAGEARTDSTGTQTGTVVGDGLDTVESSLGTMATDFGGARIEYPGDVGGDHDRFTVSTVSVITDAELATLSGDAPIVAKESATDDGLATFWQGVRAHAEVGTRLAGNSFEFGDVDLNHSFAMPETGTPHLVTQTYDGMTYSVFIDGEEVHSEMLEYRTTFSDPAVLTTIGDYATNDGELSAPFPGVIDEVQIAGVPFTPDFEAFRYANYFGDAVTVGERAQREDDPVQLIIGTPEGGAELEAGLVDVTGTVSKRATITASVAGDVTASEEVGAGSFAIEVPVNALGEQTITFTATGEDGTTAADVAATVLDTVAPAPPHVADDAADAGGDDAAVTLTATPRTEDLERTTATFYADELLDLDAGGTVVRTGTTTDRLPDALTPQSGEVTDELSPTTVGEDENPFQIYEIPVPDDQAAEGQLHLSWRGTADDRPVSAYVYDHDANTWLLKDSGASSAGDEVTLDVTARSDEGALADGVLHLLVWRGLTSLPTDAGYDFEQLPDPATYDWAFDHVPDTQLYAQATPELMVDQFEYVAEVADERKTQIAVQAGDLVNRPYLSQEYQYLNAEPAVAAWEDAGLPYMVSWGNHDYHDVDEGRNTRLMLPTYFPMSRLEASLEDSAFTFGGSHEIDNYYYTAEIDGAKLLFLTVGFFSIDDGDESGIAWAQDVIAGHQDHAVVLAVHNSVNTEAGRWSNDHVVDNLVTPYANVELVLGGHVTGTGVASARTAGGGTAYGVLTDYQGRVYGGQQYLKHISVDAENDLMYFNTYSPLLDTATSDGPWHNEIGEGEVPGLYGHDTENFVLEIDLGGTTTRTLATSSLTVAAGEPAQVGSPQHATGDEPVSVVLDDVTPDQRYGWFVELEDAAGHVTRSTVSAFVGGAAATPEAPGTPTDVMATVSGDAITAEWSAPGDDGGAPVEQYEVTLSDGTTATVGGGLLSAVLDGVAPGDYTATVRALNSVGWSESSAASEPVVVEEDGPGSPDHHGTIDVTGDLVPGGGISVSGTGFVPGVDYEVQLRSTPTGLGTATADDAGAFTVAATVPASVAVGEHRVVVRHGGEEVASALVDIRTVDTDDGDDLPDGDGDGSGVGTGDDGGTGGDATGDGGGSDDGGADAGAGTGSDASGGLPATGADGTLFAWLSVLALLVAAAGAGLVVSRRGRPGR
ncbi:metallophosphoesterase [Georgenia sp. MJ170]|uniref:metallophosphoesterase n=1 Tax=Georgenia sunbinii TaxID=3117728 RepID=UPI002F2655E3